MSFFEALALGLTQGLTEFIPVSSSGHLVIIHQFLGSTEYDLAVDAVLQLATILAVFVYFRKELISLIETFFRIIFRKETLTEDRVILYAIILGTIPALILGILFESSMETVFRNSHLVAYALIVGSAIMFLGERFKPKTSELSVKSGFFIGLFQALAIVPGMSRSGMTISGGLFSGLDREKATRFSFLLSFPIIFGSGMKKLFELTSVGSVLNFELGISFIVSFIVGLFAIHYLLKYLRTHTLNAFVLYRLILAVIILLFV